MPTQMPPRLPTGEPPDEDQDEGDVLDIPQDQEPDVVDTPDGGAYVTFDNSPQAGMQSEFFENLADKLPASEIRNIVIELIDLIEQDKSDREKHDKLQAEGIKRTGFSDEAPGGAEFQGASKVVHPMLGKAAVDYSARVIKEIFPSDGPVKGKIVGDVTVEKEEKAERKVQHMNWQLTEQMPEFRPTLEQLETQVPMGGVQYLKMYYNPMLKRPYAEPVWTDQLLLPSAAPSFLAARRRTVLVLLTEQQYQERVDAGMYVDVDLVAPGMPPEATKSEAANERIEGKSIDPYNEDGVRLIYETYVWRAVESDDKRPEDWQYAPYIISIDESTQECLGFYRNWDEQLSTQRNVVQEIPHIVEFAFVPWRGVYPIGLFHLIGGLTIAATGALRSLLDSAFLNNSMSGIKLKGVVDGQNINAKQTQVQEIKGSINADDVKKLFMPYPFNPPQPVLFELLGFLTEQGESVVQTALEDAADTNANAPVGTTLARIEQGMQVFAAIHLRQHYAMAQVLKILHRINRDTLTQPVIQEDTGELLALPEDYEGPMDVVPVSDPNIFSEAQRIAQTQVVAGRAMGNPLYDQAKVEERILKTLKIPDPEELLVTPPEPEPADPVSENVALSFGRPATAFPNQDHVSHLIVHLRFLTDKYLGMSQLIGPTLVPAMLNHVKEHLVLCYAKLVGDTVNRAAGMEVQGQLDQSPKTQNAFARSLAAASQHVQEEEINFFANVQQAVEMAIQFMKSIQQQMQPPDPTMAVAQLNAQTQTQTAGMAAQAAQAETQRKAAKDQADSQAKMADLSIKHTAVQGDVQREQQAAAVQAGQIKLQAQQNQASNDLEQQRQALEDKLGTLTEQVKLIANREDNATAMRIALMELTGDVAMHKEKIKAQVSTGHGVGRGPSPSMK